MNQKHYIGKRVSGIELYDELGPITGVALVLDSENEVFAGDETGYVLEMECPYATPAMAEAVLASVVGQTYKGFRASEAPLPIEAELGDGITVNGTYSMLAYRLLKFGPGHMSEIAAPGENTIDHEYPYISSTEREIRRNNAKVFSEIRKTSEEILLRVQGVDDKYTSLSVTLDGVTITDATGTTRIKGSSIDVSTLNVNDINLNGRIAWADLDSTTRSTITNASNAASSAQTAASAFADMLLTSGGQTYIDGSRIYANSIYASALHLGGNLTVYTTATGYAAGGYLGYTSSLLDGSAGIHMACGSGEVAATQNGARLMYGNSNYQVYIGGSNAGIAVGGVYYYFFSNKLYPSSQVPLGDASYRWGQIYTTTSVSVSSDRNAKNSIEDLPEKYMKMLASLTPKRFKLNDGTSGRYHVGFIAQEVEDAMTAAGIDSTEFGGFIKAEDEEGNPIYMLRYEEFIGILVAIIKRLLEAKNGS